LAPNGYLFLGHSEQLGPFQANFESLGRTTFRKKG
jgi:chemotaxis methyl-accepting protein methylase